MYITEPHANSQSKGMKVLEKLYCTYILVLYCVHHSSYINQQMCYDFSKECSEASGFVACWTSNGSWHDLTVELET
jgi:hypothetical protein